MNEQAFTWLRRRALHMHKLLPWVLGRQQTSGCNNISHLLCQNDGQRSREGNEIEGVILMSMTKTRKADGNIQWHEISLFVTPCDLLNFFNRYMGKGVRYIRYSICYCRQKNYNKTFFFKETAPLKRGLKHFQKYNVFYWCRNLLLLHWITRF